MLVSMQALQALRNNLALSSASRLDVQAYQQLQALLAGGRHPPHLTQANNIFGATSSPFHTPQTLGKISQHACRVQTKAWAALHVRLCGRQGCWRVAGSSRGRLATAASQSMERCTVTCRWTGTAALRMHRQATLLSFPAFSARRCQ